MINIEKLMHYFTVFADIDMKQVMETAKCALQNLHQIIQDECEAPEMAPVEGACKSEADRNGK